MADSFMIGQERTADRTATLLRLTGELDINAREDLLAAILAAIDDGDVIVDLAAVTFLDSEALSAFIDGYHAAREADVRFAVANAGGMVGRVLAVSGTLDLFDKA